MEETIDENSRYEITEAGKLHLKQLQTYIIEFESDIDVIKYTSVNATTLEDAKEKFEEKWPELLNEGCKVSWHPIYTPQGKVLTNEEIKIKIDEYSKS